MWNPKNSNTLPQDFKECVADQLLWEQVVTIIGIGGHESGTTGHDIGIVKIAVLPERWS